MFIKKKSWIQSAAPYYVTASVTKGYTFIGASDVLTTVGGATTFDYPVTMTGTTGRLIFITISQLTSITSVVYDPAGANITLTQDFSNGAGPFNYVYSGLVPSASGAKVVRVNYSGSITFDIESGAAWLATGLVSGFQSTVTNPNPTVVAGNFVFGITWSVGGAMTDGYVANSNQTPTGHRLSTILLSGAQYSATVDFATPASGLTTLSSATQNVILNAVYN